MGWSIYFSRCQWHFKRLLHHKVNAKKQHHWLQFAPVYWGLGQELNNQQATNKHPEWRAAFIPQWRDITGRREASHTTVSAIWQNFLPIQCCLQYLEKLSPLAVINGNLDKEQVFHSGWGAFKKWQISLRKYWYIPVFNLLWFGKGSQLQCTGEWISVCFTESLFCKMLLLRLSLWMCHSWLAKIL